MMLGCLWGIGETGFPADAHDAGFPAVGERKAFLADAHDAGCRALA